MFGFCKECLAWVSINKENNCAPCFAKGYNSYAKPAYLMKDAELEAIAERPLKTKQPTDAIKQEIKETDFFELAKDDLSYTLAGELAKPLATFHHYATVFAKNTSRNLILTGRSGAGKEAVSNAVADLFPQDIVIRRRRISARVVDYMWRETEHWWLTGRLLILEDIEPNVLAQSASLKTFASAPTNRAHTVTVVDKGKAKSLRILGAPTISLTTARGAPEEELLTRFDSLEITNTPEQIQQILTKQADGACGNGQCRLSQTQKLMQYLYAVETIVPYANAIARIWRSSPRATREFPRFINLIKASAALHQYAREKDEQNRVLANDIDYEHAVDSYTSFVSGGLGGMTTPQLDVYRSVQAACKMRETAYLEIKNKETNYEPQPCVALAGCCTAQDVIEHNSKYSDKTVYDLLGLLVEQGVISFSLQRDLANGSNRPTKVYSLMSNLDQFLPPFDALKQE